MQIFADCADISVMRSLSNQVTGFTTNPTLMKAAGVSDYETFAKECVTAFPNHSISFEVIADDIETMRRQAYKLSAYGPNVYVKIPVSTTDGNPTFRLVEQLSQRGVRVNVTAIFTQSQATLFNEALQNGAPAYLSIFAGRIADTGNDPAPFIQSASENKCNNVKILWASAREVFNVKQALQAGADIITLTPDLIAKYVNFGKDLREFSLDTVKMFRNDALAAGLTL